MGYDRFLAYIFGWGVKGERSNPLKQRATMLKMTPSILVQFQFCLKDPNHHAIFVIYKAKKISQSLLIFIHSIFDTLEALAAHVTQSHAVASLDGLYHCKWQSCPRSDRGFNARYKMLVHVRTHTKEKPHACDQCTKR